MRPLVGGASFVRRPGCAAAPCTEKDPTSVFTAETALLAVTAVHVGFQTTVTMLVYPALARVSAQEWASAHQIHSRTITPLVAVVYGALVIVCGWVLVSGAQAWTLVAVAAVAATFVSTGFAAHLHGLLGAGHDRARIGRLLLVDRIRLAAAVTAFAAAVLAVL